MSRQGFVSTGTMYGGIQMTVFAMPYSLVSLIAPKEEGDELSVVRHLLQMLDDGEPVALEIAALDGEVLLLVRSRRGPGVRDHLVAQFGHYGLLYMSEMDPLAVEDHEQVWTLNLGHDIDPRHLLGDLGRIDGGDPLRGVIGAMAGGGSGCRAVARMILKRSDFNSLLSRAKGEGGRSFWSFLPWDVLSDTRVLVAVVAGLLSAVLLLASEASRALFLEGDSSQLSALVTRLLPWAVGVAGIAGTAMLLAVIRALLRAPASGTFDFGDREQVEERYRLGCYEAQIQVHAILPDHPGSEGDARRLLSSVRGAYRSYSQAGGASRIDVGKTMVQSVPTDLLALPSEAGWRHPGYLKDVSTIGPDEAALYFHAIPSLMERRQHRLLAAPTRAIDKGAPFGTTTGDRTPRTARLSDDTRHHHQVAVGASRQGKSTFMLHNGLHEMIENAHGRESAAVVVVDPHGTLAESLLHLAPYAMRDRVRLLDLTKTNTDRLPGINVLDTRVFKGRDRSVSDAGAIVKGLWPEFWGPLMQDALDNALRAIYEANSSMVRAEDQYTLIDVGLMFKHEAFREEVLRRVSDERVRDWWLTDFTNMSQKERRENTRSIRTRLTFFANSNQLRAILGQPVTTLDIGAAIERGDVVLVSTGRGTQGNEVASLVGSTVLHIVNGALMRRGELPTEQRKRVMLIVDEMQTILGVDFSAMGGETSKFGCAMIVGTQSLAKLNELKPPMRATILANMSCLTVLRSTGGDAGSLAAELGPEVDPDDITSLHPFHAYVRVTSNGERFPAYSVKFNRPGLGNPQMAELIQRASDRYSNPVDEVERLINARLSPYIQGGLSRLSGFLEEEED